MEEIKSKVIQIISEQIGKDESQIQAVLSSTKSQVQAVFIGIFSNKMDACR